ncbi:MAG: LysM peptidoglycan-binding domain-containing protein, partial [Bacillota bacterium]|nr:LysM peptidoglycan-binding domain-containing protein [Bacillota bacterium]
MNQIFYTVQPGDTLYQIANRWAIPLETLIIANNIKAPYVIYPGVQLSMPPGDYCYRIKAGDTIYNISKNFKVPMAAIIEANNIRPPYSIKQDDVIIVPPGVTFYVVQPGDTLWNIAQRYNTQVDLIREANQISSQNLSIGKKLKVPYFVPSGHGKVAYTSIVDGKYT